MFRVSFTTIIDLQRVELFCNLPLIGDNCTFQTKNYIDVGSLSINTKVPVGGQISIIEKPFEYSSMSIRIMFSSGNCVKCMCDVLFVENNKA